MRLFNIFFHTFNMWRTFILLLFLPDAIATLQWVNAPVYQIETHKFQQKVLDSYDIPSKLAMSTSTFTPELDENSGENPYKSTNLTKFALFNKDVGVDSIPVYDLEGRVIKRIEDIFVECYEINDCSYALTEDDRKELSIYASYIENSGMETIKEDYSLGLIRAKASVNVLGMYTEGFVELKNRIGFWIRLQNGDGSRKYSTLAPYEKTVSLLDLSVHERSHYDRPYHNGMAHCDGFQSNYNYLFQKVSRNLEAYKNLVGDDNGRNWEWYEIVIVAVAGFFVLSTIVLLVMFSRSQTPARDGYSNLNYA